MDRGLSVKKRDTHFGLIGTQGPTDRIIYYEVVPGVAVFIPQNYVHRFRNLNPDREFKIRGAYSVPHAGEYEPEDYKYLRELTGQGKKLK